MSKKEDNSESTTFPEKWNKVLKDLPEFKEKADASSPEELKKIIILCEGNIYNVDKEQEADVKLNAAKEMAKELAAPYRDAKKVQTAKIQYALFRLENSGTEIGG